MARSETGGAVRVLDAQLTLLGTAGTGLRLAEPSDRAAESAAGARKG